MIGEAHMVKDGLLLLLMEFLEWPFLVCFIKSFYSSFLIHGTKFTGKQSF